MSASVSKYIRNSVSRNSFKRVSVASKAIKEKAINFKTKVLTKKVEKSFNDTNYYGKTTKAMIAKNIAPYSWTKEPELKSFVPIEKSSICPHLTKDVEKCENVSDFFNFFINDEMIDLLVNSTNSKLALYSIDKEYIYKNNLELVNRIEIRGFFGLLLLFGVLQKRNVDIHEIWSEDGNIHHCYYATAAMPRARFKVISCCLSYDELESRNIRKQSDPKFYKMRDFFEAWRKNLRNVYEPGPDLCVDETL